MITAHPTQGDGPDFEMDEGMAEDDMEVLLGGHLTVCQAVLARWWGPGAEHVERRTAILVFTSTSAHATRIFTMASRPYWVV